MSCIYSCNNFEAETAARSDGLFVNNCSASEMDRGDFNSNW